MEFFGNNIVKKRKVTCEYFSHILYKVYNSKNGISDLLEKARPSSAFTILVLYHQE